MKKIIITIILFLGLVGSYRLLRPGFFSMQDDMHIFRLQQFDQCFHDGQIPCRYIADGGMGYGYPLFNFYSPFPYIIGEIFHLIGFSYINSIKAVFVITSFIRPLGIYLLSSFFFGTTGGLVSAIIFSLAPYQAINSFVRGAIAENLALALLPFIFWSLFRKKYFLFTILITSLALTHNLTLFYSLPLILFTIIFQHKKWRQLIIHLLIGLGIAAFFIIPAFIEKKYTTVNTMTQGYFDYIVHFVTVPQLFINHNDWGFGASLWGPKDDMSFQVGYLQWILPVISTVLAFIFKNKHRILLLSTFLSGIMALFMTHNKSTFIWQHFPFLPFFQFPWRFLGPAILIFSLLSGFFITQKPFKKIPSFVITIILVLELILNFNFFKEDIWFPNLTDQQKLSGENLIAQSGAGLKDYWPNFGQTFPTTYAPNQPIVTNNANIINYHKNSRQITADIKVISDDSLITFPVVYFPSFEVKDNNSITPYFVDHDLGLINVYLSTGDHHLTINFTNTLIRFTANVISIVSLIIFGLFYRYREK